MAELVANCPRCGANKITFDLLSAITTVRKQDAEDLLDFSKILLERIYTEPERLRLAEERRKERRENNGK